MRARRNAQEMHNGESRSGSFGVEGSIGLGRACCIYVS